MIDSFMLYMRKSILKTISSDKFRFTFDNRRVHFRGNIKDIRIFEVEELDEELPVNRKGKRKIDENDISTEYDDWDLEDTKGVEMSELYIDDVYVLNHPCISVVIKRFSIPRKLLVKVLSFTFQKNIESPSHSLSIKLVSTIAKRLKKDKNKAFNEVERLLCITLKHHILTFFKTKNNAKLLHSIEDKILEILQCPLKFSIRILLVTLLIFVSGHPFTESFYRVKLDSLARQLEYNVIMLHYISEEENVISESISPAEEYELRFMIINFLEYFCQDTPYFEDLSWTEYSSNAFLVCLDDTVKKLAKLVNRFIKAYPYQTNYIETKTIKLTFIVNHMIPHLSCLYDCGFFEGKMINGVAYSVLANIARTMVAIFNNEENKKKLTKKTFCYILKGCFLSLSTIGIFICKTAFQYSYFKRFLIQLESWVAIITALYKLEHEIIEDEAKKKKIIEDKVNENKTVDNDTKENENIKCRNIEKQTNEKEFIENKTKESETVEYRTFENQRKKSENIIINDSEDQALESEIIATEKNETLEYKSFENQTKVQDIIEAEDVDNKTKENVAMEVETAEDQSNEHVNMEIETLEDQINQNKTLEGKTIGTEDVKIPTVKDKFIEEVEGDKNEIIKCRINAPEPISEKDIDLYRKELQFYWDLSVGVYRRYIEKITKGGVLYI
uniref:DUF3437 domain-containing protein n=2 Tax=Strongyloides stercoralis TaxID=6248 RepID=A0A0K0E1Z2_STRER